MPHKCLPIVHEEVVHFRPNGIILRFYRVLLERDVARPAQSLYRFHIAASEVSLVCGQIGDLEVLRRASHQRVEEVGVVNLPAAYVHGGYHVRFHTTHKVTLEPLAAMHYVHSLRQNLPVNKLGLQEIYGKGGVGGHVTGSGGGRHGGESRAGGCHSGGVGAWWGARGGQLL